MLVRVERSLGRERVVQAIGWFPTDLETNDISRLRLPAEPVLDAQARAVALELFGQQGWQVTPLMLRKLSYFWLSTDQLFWTSSFSLPQRLVRAGGVLAYWAALVLSVWGWLRLWERRSPAAGSLLLYVLVLTILHLPFVMITRLRIPVMDPLVVILAGGGWSTIYQKFLGRAEKEVS